MSTPNYKLTRLTCFYTYLAMASVFCIPSMLFLTFKESYGISFTLLGSLVMINFSTQFAIDLIFTFFSKHFNIKWTIRIMPLLTALGLLIYALIPTLFPNVAYLGLCIGTFVFSIAAGLCEVLLSPLIASLPSEHPDRDMSLLHSLYGYGVLFMVSIASIFLAIFGREHWMVLVILLAIFPIISCILFCMSPIPDMNQDGSSEKGNETHRRRLPILALCTACIFLGSSAENAMTNWLSSFLESALGIEKALGDILGLAVFAVLLALTRSFYAKYGRNIIKVLLFGMIGSVICYATAALSPIPLIAMLACVLTGICTSMLWPGTLILMEEKLPGPGVAAYALMAAGGDFGASIAPQLLGVIVDTVSKSTVGQSLAQSLSLTPDQLGMKAGMLVAAIFPFLGVFLLLFMMRYFKKHKD